MNRDDMDFGGLARDLDRKREAEPITPPAGYGNGREGASAPDAPPDAAAQFNLDNAGRTILSNLRCPACHASVVMFKDQIQFDKRTGKHFLITDCCKAAINYHTDGYSSVTATPRRAADICAEAARLVGGDRETTHGDKSINFVNTAALWEGYLFARSNTHPDKPTWKLDALDVGNMLELFKIARRLSGQHNLDDYIDGAGYAGCAGEIAEKMNGPKP